MSNMVTVAPCPKCGGTEVSVKHKTRPVEPHEPDELVALMKMTCIRCGKAAVGLSMVWANAYDNEFVQAMEMEVPYYWQNAIAREQREAAELEAALRAFILFFVDGSSESAVGVFATLEEAQASANSIIDTDGPPYIEEWRGVRCMNSWVLEDGEWVLDA